MNLKSLTQGWISGQFLLSRDFFEKPPSPRCLMMAVNIFLTCTTWSSVRAGNNKAVPHWSTNLKLKFCMIFLPTVRIFVVYLLNQTGLLCLKKMFNYWPLMVGFFWVWGWEASFTCWNAWIWDIRCIPLCFSAASQNPILVYFIILFCFSW